MGIEWRSKELMAKTAIRILKGTGWYAGYWNQWRGRIFDYAERHGLHILPVHFYTPVPEVSKFGDGHWGGDSPDPTGIALRTEEALALIERLAGAYRSEYEDFPYVKPDDPHAFYLSNAAFHCGDAEILYGLLRDLKPRRMVEVGSGNSSLVAAQAFRRNLRDDPASACEFVCVEPYPPAYLTPLPDGVTRMIPLPVQEAPLETFTALGAGDILFIDSSHVVAIGSDVVHLFNEVLPRLAPGVIVHVHDIFLPYDYPSAWLREGRYFWNEQYLLQAFLLFNDAFEVMIPAHAVARRHPDEFDRCIPSCRRHDALPGSFWMRRRGGSA